MEAWSSAPALGRAALRTQSGLRIVKPVRVRLGRVTRRLGLRHDPLNLQLVGLKRTCTNWLGLLVEQNFPGTRCWHGPKHDIPPLFVAKRDGFLICVKDPYAWVLSMRRYAYRGPIETLVDVWNLGVRAQLEFMSAREDAFLVRYESLLADAPSVLTQLAEFFNLTLPERWVIEERQMLRGGDTMRGARAIGDESFQAAYYLNRDYLDELSADDRRALRDGLDAGLLRRLEYA